MYRKQQNRNVIHIKIYPHQGLNAKNKKPEGKVFLKIKQAIIKSKQMHERPNSTLKL